MAAFLAVMILFSPLWMLLLFALGFDRFSDESAERFARYVRLTWAQEHPEEPY